MVAYAIVRGAQWRILLKALDIHVRLRSQIFAFAACEVTKSMPNWPLLPELPAPIV